MRTRRGQRGFSLVMAVAIISLLSMVGLMVLGQAATDVQLAGAERAAQNNLFLAEAGSVWAVQAVNDLLYPPGSAANASANVAALTALTPLGSADALCPENSCVSPPCPTPIVCSNWFLLTPTPVSYGGGTYRAAATCNPNCSVAAPSAYSVRTMGSTPDGAQRLLEVMLGP